MTLISLFLLAELSGDLIKEYYLHQLVESCRNNGVGFIMHNAVIVSVCAFGFMLNGILDIGFGIDHCTGAFGHRSWCRAAARYAFAKKTQI